MYWHNLLQSAPTPQHHLVQHCQPMPSNYGFTKPEDDKPQPARAWKLGTTSAGFHSCLKMLLKLHMLVLMHSP